MFERATFGAFELDLGRHELRKRGIRLRLPDQSFEILTMLVERPGEIVAREEIRGRLWPNGTVVEFEHSVNSALKRLRDALGDSGSNPRFIETVPKRGYRFRAPVEIGRASADGARYRIIDEAGRGAMGVVYRAEDVRLGRPVALKFLPPDLAGDPVALERLRREARIAAALNHPGICTLYGMEEHEGRLCLVMELLEGRSLNQLIAGGPLPPEQAMDLAIQVCEGLIAAHARGIVHRDIKPANLFVTTGGRAKVTDFGIASWVKDADTASGGTPSYASPEQACGGEPDHRSDIFSLGAVLKEMVTGRRMFSDGQTLPLQYPPTMPKGLESIISRCVERDPGRRFQTAEDLKAALEKVRGRRAPRLRWIAAIMAALVFTAGALTWKLDRLPRAPGTRIRSIAVLPLVNMSGDPGQEYFADGMTEVLTSDLAQLSGLRVTSRTSAMTYKGSPKPLAAIAGNLNVDAVVEGSVSRSGPRVRIVAQLIEASSDTHLWSRSYDRDFEDVLQLQSELAQAIAQEIKVAVTAEERVRLTAGRPVKPEAYEAYLKGMYYLNRFTPEGFAQGMPYLQQAIDKDPSDPFPHASLALGYSIMGHDRFPDAFPRAKAAALKSLELGGPVAEAYVALGMVKLYWDWDFSGAEQVLRRALELNPNFAEARRNYSWYLVLRDRPKEGIAEMKRAVELEPLVPIFPADLAWQLLEQRDFDGALAAARKALELNPDFPQALAIEGWVYAEWGRTEEALAAHRKAAAADPSWKFNLARTYALTGRKDEARKIAAEMARKPGPMDQWGLAVVYTALGEKDEALRRLEAAYQARFSWVPWSDIELFAPLFHDPRFTELVRRVGVVRSHQSRN